MNVTLSRNFLALINIRRVLFQMGVPSVKSLFSAICTRKFLPTSNPNISRIPIFKRIESMGETCSTHERYDKCVGEPGGAKPPKRRGRNEKGV